MTYKVQIDNTVRDATPEEAAQLDAQRAEADAALETAEAINEARASARNKLKALGLTDAEIAALVG